MAVKMLIKFNKSTLDLLSLMENYSKKRRNQNQRGK